jgi:ubiquitin-protein ligase
MSNEEFRTITVEAPSGERFEADIPCGTALSKLAADFFEAQGWPTQDRRGRGQRAVVELVHPENPDETKRLSGELDICEALVNGDTVRIFPESIAGAVDQHARLNALIADHNDMRLLTERNPSISFTANLSHAPDRYEITFYYPSFIELLPNESKPLQDNTHKVEIALGADYPRRAPIVRWLTPIFHPNIRPTDGAVCLGILYERYLPGLGLKRVVELLAEMVQWHNYDAYHAFNRQAAEWATDPAHWQQILDIGGHPFQGQGPIGQLIEKARKGNQPPIQFRRLLQAH